MRSRDDIENEDDTRRQPSACQCHFEMPGSCPGPANCPMCEGDDDDD